MSEECHHCCANYFKNEADSNGAYIKCCNGGRLVTLTPRKGVSEPLMSLLTNAHPKSTSFLDIFENLTTYSRSLPPISSDTKLKSEQVSPVCWSAEKSKTKIKSSHEYQTL